MERSTTRARAPQWTVTDALEALTGFQREAVSPGATSPASWTSTGVVARENNRR